MAIVPDSSSHVTSINVIFPDDVATTIRQLSQDMNLGFGQFFPHMTLIYSSENAVTHFLSIAAGLPLMKEIVVEGIDFIPEVAQHVVWVELHVRKTKELMELRKHLLDAAGSYKAVGLDVDAYRPHVTLGCISLDEVQRINMSAMNIDKVRSISNLAIKVGRNGDYGKVIEILDDGSL